MRTYTIDDTCLVKKIEHKPCRYIKEPWFEIRAKIYSDSQEPWISQHEDYLQVYFWLDGLPYRQCVITRNDTGRSVTLVDDGDGDNFSADDCSDFLTEDDCGKRIQFTLVFSNSNPHYMDREKERLEPLGPYANTFYVSSQAHAPSLDDYDGECDSEDLPNRW